LVALGMMEKRGGKYAKTPDTDLFLDRVKPSYIGGILQMPNSRLYSYWGSLATALCDVHLRTPGALPPLHRLSSWCRELSWEFSERLYT